MSTGAAKASELFRYFAGGGTPTPIGRALIELGKLDRSIYLACYFNDELLHRRVHTQLNRQESRHTLARPVTPSGPHSLHLGRHEHPVDLRMGDPGVLADRAQPSPLTAGVRCRL